MTGGSISWVLLLLTSTGIGCQSRADRTAPAAPAISSRGSEDPDRLRAAPVVARDAAPGTMERRDVPPAVRELLRDPMQRHAESMRSLLWSSLNLQYLLIVQRSQWVLEEPRIARPDQGDDKELVNRFLPPQFLDLQDALRGQASLLLRAAERRDDEGIARAYGEMASICIRCHGLYLRLPPPEAP